MDIEIKVKEFCRIMDIKIVNGKVPESHKRKIEDYIHSLVKRKEFKQLRATKLSDILKGED